ncbi:craniofacial development protein 2-like [Penaeus japonicus]|uniref:craniofacial development protein 2-like n=1 Tax=Penaeus japonicus TaxID=27405 RepID=UPI001C71317A|nr:craniofacial development protein 2-like [Penaeus japonicus]
MERRSAPPFENCRRITHDNDNQTHFHTGSVGAQDKNGRAVMMLTGVAVLSGLLMSSFEERTTAGEEHMHWHLEQLRWTGIGETSTEDGHKLWHSGAEKKHERGVGVLVEKETAKSVIECTPVSDRIIAIRLKGKPRNMTIIQIYAPTSDSEDEEIERFYQDLEQTIKEKAKKDILVIQGDWNAKIGYKESTGWEGTIGDCGVGTRNERGIMLLEFAKRHHLVVANTLHNHKLSRRTTWHSPDGVTHNQIDYILVDRRFQTGINRPKTRTFKKTDIGSDHNPVMMTFRKRLSKEKKVSQRRTKFDLEKLKDRNTTNEILGKAKPIKRPWITPEILQKCEERRELKKNRFTNNESLGQYRKANKEVKRAIIKAKDNWVEKQAEDIEQSLAVNNSRKAYSVIKSLTKEKTGRTNVIEGKTGQLLTNNTSDS